MSAEPPGVPGGGGLAGSQRRGSQSPRLSSGPPGKGRWPHAEGAPRPESSGPGPGQDGTQLPAPRRPPKRRTETRAVKNGQAALADPRRHQLRLRRCWVSAGAAERPEGGSGGSTAGPEGPQHAGRRSRPHPTSPGVAPPPGVRRPRPQLPRTAGLRPPPAPPLPPLRPGAPAASLCDRSPPPSPPGRGSVGSFPVRNVQNAYVLLTELGFIRA